LITVRELVNSHSVSHSISCHCESSCEADLFLLLPFRLIHPSNLSYTTNPSLFIQNIQANDSTGRSSLKRILLVSPSNTSNYRISGVYVSHVLPRADGGLHLAGEQNGFYGGKLMYALERHRQYKLVTIKASQTLEADLSKELLRITIQSLSVTRLAQLVNALFQR
jgi:hypothetical protein